MAITNYWSGHTVESANKERERLKKKYARGSGSRKADNLDNEYDRSMFKSRRTGEDIDRAIDEAKKMRDAAP